MSFEEKRRLLLQFDALIRNKTKGTSRQFARQMNVSESTFFRLLDCMRGELEAPILFDDEYSRYTYQKKGRIYIGFIPEIQATNNIDHNIFEK